VSAEQLWQQAKIGLFPPRSGLTIRIMPVILCAISQLFLKATPWSPGATGLPGQQPPLRAMENGLGGRVRRESEALSTSMSQPDPFSWKQEVSRSLAAHQSRRGLSTLQPAAPVRALAASSRAATVAARVAARYAQAPSFSQMRAAEAHAALRAAEAATQAALEANATAQAALAGLEAAPRQPEPEAVTPALGDAPDREPVLAPFRSVAPSSLDVWEEECARIQWEPEPRLRPLEPASAPAAFSAPRPAEAFATATEDQWESPASSSEPEESWDTEELQPVEPAQPIHANLIEFPRELIATRRMRPRRAEGPFAEEDRESQLSIFEVDPEAISTQPEEAEVASEPEWSGIELEAQPQDEPESPPEPDSQLTLQQASGSRRLMALLVDGMLIAGVLLGGALVAAEKVAHPPAIKIVALGAVVAILLAGLIYQTLFLTLAAATPGMRCARISFCTFDGQKPTRGQLCGRLGALLLSVVPVGLGVAWALFDDDRLCWHDRLSRTYLRKC
jgi:uncharacterized RDD family membrane protein YckC